MARRIQQGARADVFISANAGWMDALEAGRVLRRGAAAEVLGDATAMGARGTGPVLQAHVVAHQDDGLTELAAAAGPLWLPRVAAAPGQSVRLRIEAQGVILSCAWSQGLSALNILAGQVRAIHPGHGPGALVVLDSAKGRR